MKIKNLMLSHMRRFLIILLLVIAYWYFKIIYGYLLYGSRIDISFLRQTFLQENFENFYSQNEN